MKNHAGRKAELEDGSLNQTNVLSSLDTLRDALFTCLTSNNKGNWSALHRRSEPHRQQHARALFDSSESSLFHFLSLLPTPTVLISHFLASSFLALSNTPPGISSWPLQKGRWVSITWHLPGQRGTLLSSAEPQPVAGVLWNHETFSLFFTIERRETAANLVLIIPAERFNLLFVSTWRRSSCKKKIDDRVKSLCFRITWCNLSSCEVWRQFRMWLRFMIIRRNACQVAPRFY